MPLKCVALSDCEPCPESYHFSPGDSCKKAYCREAEDQLGAVSDVEIIELDDDNNLFVDSFSALDSSIAVESGKFVTHGAGNEDALAARFDHITYFTCGAAGLLHHTALNLLQFELIILALLVVSTVVWRYRRAVHRKSHAASMARVLGV